MRSKVFVLTLGAACASAFQAASIRQQCSTTFVATTPSAKVAAKPSRKFALHVTGGGSAATAPKDEGVGMVPSTFNLMKNILGAGVLSLPAGVAAFSNSQTALVPALALTATLGLTSGYCFATIGRLCESKLGTEFLLLGFGAHHHF
jgi:sodium-coupled neutral amino acid transporter 11